MVLHTATFIVCLNKQTLPFLKLFKSNIEKSGVRYELFLVSDISELEATPDYSELQPKLIIENTNKNHIDFTHKISQSFKNISTSNVFFILEPFLCNNDWAKNYINEKNNLQDIGSFVIPFSTYINNLNLTYTLDRNFELKSVYDLELNKYCGIYLFSTDRLNLLGAIDNCETLEEAIVKYSIRASKLGYKTIASLQLIIPIQQPIDITVDSKKVKNLQIAVRTFTPIEEMAYHDLDNLFYEENLPAQKFLFEFSCVFGFRCMCLNKQNLEKIDWYATRFNLKYEIKSKFLNAEQKLNNNVWVIFNTKE
jgi:hypothetical protein